MAVFDKEHIGDNQEKAWRPFTNNFFADGVNDFGYFNFNEWNGNNIANYFAPDKIFSYSMWFKYPSSNPFALALFSCNYSLSSLVPDYYLSSIGLVFGFPQWYAIHDIPILIGQNYHIVVTYTGGTNANNVKIYLNGVDLDSIGHILRVNNFIPSLPYVINYLGLQINDTVYFTANYADFRFFADQVLTPQEVRQLYHGNWETNLLGRTELLRLPMTLPSHFATNTPAGLCTALDNSGNANNLIIEGQGTTPTTSLFY